VPCNALHSPLASHPCTRIRPCRCLETAAEEHDESFTSDCREAVAKFEEMESSDYRLNFRLAEACKQEVPKLCPNACGELAREWPWLLACCVLLFCSLCEGRAEPGGAALHWAGLGWPGRAGCWVRKVGQGRAGQESDAGWFPVVSQVLEDC